MGSQEMLLQQRPVPLFRFILYLLCYFIFMFGDLRRSTPEARVELRAISTMNVTSRNSIDLCKTLSVEIDLYRDGRFDYWKRGP